MFQPVHNYRNTLHLKPTNPVQNSMKQRRQDSDNALPITILNSLTSCTSQIADGSPLSSIKLYGTLTHYLDECERKCASTRDRIIFFRRAQKGREHEIRFPRKVEWVKSPNKRWLVESAESCWLQLLVRVAECDERGAKNSIRSIKNCLFLISKLYCLLKWYGNIRWTKSKSLIS